MIRLPIQGLIKSNFKCETQTKQFLLLRDGLTAISIYFLQLQFREAIRLIGKPIQNQVIAAPNRFPHEIMGLPIITRCGNQSSSFSDRATNLLFVKCAGLKCLVVRPCFPRCWNCKIFLITEVITHLGAKKYFMKVFKSNYSGFLLIPFLYNNTSHNIQLNNIRNIRNEIYKKY